MGACGIERPDGEWLVLMYVHLEGVLVHFGANHMAL